MNGLPTWQEALDGAAPPGPEHDDPDAGEWRRGWQFHLSAALERRFLQQHVIPASCPARQALRLSQCGPGATKWMSAIPTCFPYAIKSLRMQVALRRRIRWSLPLSCERCSGKACRAKLDQYGDHWASCPLSGRLLRRAKPLERTWARIFREAGARVLENVFLKDTALPDIAPTDCRRLEVVATGMPLFKGVPLGVDTTLVSPLHTNGLPWPRADFEAGVALQRAVQDKRTKYPVLVRSSELRLTTLAAEIGGIWSEDTAVVIDELAHARARSELPRLRASATIAWRHRWWTLLSVATQDSLAATLVDDRIALLDAVDGAPPTVATILEDSAAVGL